MIDVITDHIETLRELCGVHHVQRLEVFGSAARDDFDVERSDIDFLVVFDDVSGVNRADQYFGLQRDLEELFGRSIDLVDLFSQRNPFFLRSIKPSRIVLYEAA